MHESDVIRSTESGNSSGVSQSGPVFTLTAANIMTRLQGGTTTGAHGDQDGRVVLNDLRLSHARCRAYRGNTDYIQAATRGHVALRNRHLSTSSGRKSLVRRPTRSFGTRPRCRRRPSLKRHFGVYAFDRLQSAPPVVLAPACGCCGAAPHATPRLVSFNLPGRGDEITILILQTGGTRGWSGAARKGTSTCATSCTTGVWVQFPLKA